MKTAKDAGQLSSKSTLAEDPYLDLKALSAYSSLSVRSLRSHVNDPIDPIPCFRIRRKTLVKRSDFDRWLKEHSFKPQELDLLVDEVLADVL